MNNTTINLFWSALACLMSCLVTQGQISNFSLYLSPTYETHAHRLDIGVSGTLNTGKATGIKAGSQYSVHWRQVSVLSQFAAEGQVIQSNLCFHIEGVNLNPQHRLMADIGIVHLNVYHRSIGPSYPDNWQFRKNHIGPIVDFGYRYVPLESKFGLFTEMVALFPDAFKQYARFIPDFQLNIGVSYFLVANSE